MKVAATLLLLTCLLPCVSQQMSREQVVEDLTLLKERIQTYEPALPHYHPDFEQQSQQVIASINGDSISIFDYFTHVSKVCALAHEGHFHVGNWEDDLHKGFVNDTYTYMPLQVKLLEGKMYVLHDFSNEQSLKRGEQILSINGMPTRTILDRLLEVTPSDGDITTYAYRKIEEGFNWRYYFHISRPEQFEITLLDENKQERTETLTALVRSDHVSNIKKHLAREEDRGSSSPDAFYSLDINERYALLTLPSFDFRRVNKYEVKAKKLYQALFQELNDKGVTNLVVDLRDNTGGRNEFADDMVPFLLKASNGDPYLKKTISWEGKEKVYKLPKASKLVFQGSIFVLVNGKTFSAGNTLSRYLKEYGNATVIGEETGTRYEGFAAGSEHTIYLPHSKMRIDIPRYHILYPPSNKQKTTNRGLLPDHEIRFTFETATDGSDPYLEMVEALIGTK